MGLGLLYMPGNNINIILNNNNIIVTIIPLNGGMKKGKRGGRAAAVLRSPASELQASAGGTPSHAASPLLCTHRHHQVIVDNDYITHTSENCLYFDRLDIYFPLFVM